MATQISLNCIMNRRETTNRNRGLQPILEGRLALCVTFAGSLQRATVYSIFDLALVALSEAPNYRRVGLARMNKSRLKPCLRMKTVVGS